MGGDPLQYVNPVYDDDADYFIREALRHKHPRWELMWLLGVRSGLRISDIVRMTVSDAKTQIWTVREVKTGKYRAIEYPADVRAALEAHIVRYSLKTTDYIIFSCSTRHDHPVSRQHADRVIREAALSVGIECIGTHSMRKSFAARWVRSGGDLMALQHVLNHKYLSTTLTYLAVHKGNKTTLAI